MGVQSAAVRRLAVADVSSTYITGTLTSLTARMVRWLRSASPERAEDRFTLTEPSERGLPLTADVWLAYGVGAIVGGAAEPLWQPVALLLPAAAVAGRSRAHGSTAPRVLSPRRPIGCLPSLLTEARGNKAFWEVGTYILTVGLS
jgi:hypothetical protein